MKKEKSFEESIAELQDIVGKLESGEISLEDSLDLFERGIGIARVCRDRIVNAERRIEILTQEMGDELSIEESEFDEI